MTPALEEAGDLSRRSRSRRSSLILELRHVVLILLQLLLDQISQSGVLLLHLDQLLDEELTIGLLGLGGTGGTTIFFQEGFVLGGERLGQLADPR